jgi:hypothetical protein
LLPAQGSEIEAHELIRASQALLTGPEFPLFPVEVEIVSPIENVPGSPFAIPAANSGAPPPPIHCQFPGAPPSAGVNFTPNGTELRGLIELKEQGLVHCMPIGKRPLTELAGKVDFAVATAAT